MYNGNMFLFNLLTVKPNSMTFYDEDVRKGLDPSTKIVFAGYAYILKCIVGIGIPPPKIELVISGNAHFEIQDQVDILAYTWYYRSSRTVIITPVFGGDNVNLNCTARHQELKVPCRNQLCWESSKVSACIISFKELNMEIITLIWLLIHTQHIHYRV